MSQSKEERAMYNFRDKIRKDEVSALVFATEQGIQQVAINALKNNTSIDLISKITGLSVKEIEKQRIEKI